MVLFSPSSLYEHAFQPVQTAQLFMVWAFGCTIAFFPYSKTQSAEKKKNIFGTFGVIRAPFFSRVAGHVVCFENVFVKLAPSQALALPSCRGLLPMQFFPEESKVEDILVKHHFP